MRFCAKCIYLLKQFEMLKEKLIDKRKEKGLSQERKTELSRVMEAKIRGTLNGTQMGKLEANTALFKTLIN